MPRPTSSGGSSIPSPVVFHILLSLADRPLHGYAIMRHVREQTYGRIELGPGTLYGAVRRLLDDGWIEECEPPGDEDSEDSRRRYYRLSRAGRQVALAEIERLESLRRLPVFKRLRREPGL